jgi:hypothetical protein
VVLLRRAGPLHARSVAAPSARRDRDRQHFSFNFDIAGAAYGRMRSAGRTSIRRCEVPCEIGDQAGRTKTFFC